MEYVGIAVLAGVVLGFTWLLLKLMKSSQGKGPVTVGEYRMSEEAHLAKDLLESNSVRAIVVGGAGPDPVATIFSKSPLLPYRLQVSPEDAERAGTLLQSARRSASQSHQNEPQG